jgi:hypothetical protein
MNPNDILFGSFEFDIEIEQKDDKFIASAMGYSAEDEYKLNAISQLNEKLYNAVMSGNLTPANSDLT